MKRYKVVKYFDDHAVGDAGFYDTPEEAQEKCNELNSNTYRAYIYYEVKEVNVE